MTASPPPTIAIFGATGNLARHLTTAFLTIPALQHTYTALVLFTRRDTPATRRWAAADQRVRLVRWGAASATRQGTQDDDSDDGMSAESIARRLRAGRVDAVVNALPPAAGALRETVLRGVALAGGGGGGGGVVRVYFPPDFGLDDHVGRNGETDGSFQAGCFAVPEWEARRSHFEAAAAMLGPVGVRICRVHCGLFMHDAVGPWLGFHTARGVYSVVGSSGARTVYTDLGDVARVIAVVAQRACAGEEVPESLRTAGCVASVEEVREAMMDAGAGEVDIRTVPLKPYREKQLGRRYEDRSPFPYIKLIMASGLADWRPESEGGWGNDNELVNPGERLWKWKGMRELAVETKGRPNARA